MTNEEFVGIAIKNMLKSDISIKFTKRKKASKFDFNYFCADPPQPEFVVNYFKNRFQNIFEIFIHEYCHFLQWKDKIPLWIECDVALEKFILFIENKRKTLSRDVILPIQYLELDCDKRVTKLIKKHNLKIDTIKYIKESNAYILSYPHVLQTRKFITEIYKPDVLKHVPDKHLTQTQIKKGIKEFDEAIIKYI